MKHANSLDKVALSRKQSNLKRLENQRAKAEKSKDGVDFIRKSFFHRGQMGRIFVLNFNVLQKLTRPAAQQHPQVSGNWQEHFILNPQQDERLGIWNPSGGMLISLQWSKPGTGSEETSAHPPKTRSRS